MRLSHPAAGTRQRLAWDVPRVSPPPLPGSPFLPHFLSSHSPVNVSRHLSLFQIPNHRAEGRTLEAAVLPRLCFLGCDAFDV